MEPKNIKNKNVFSTRGFITCEDRKKILGQQSFTIWITGLSASGKSTLAFNLEKRLFELKYLAYVLDGDNLRNGINSNLGFSNQDRKENIRRTAEVAKILNHAGIISIVSLISPFKEDRELSKNIIGKTNFIEVYAKCSVDICEQRDPKGLYKKARLGEISNFTGIDSPYEEPENPDVLVRTEVDSSDKCIEKIINFLFEKKFI